MHAVMCEDEGHAAPAQFLTDHLDLLPRGRALDVAMGNGRNAVYLAHMGFQVEGVDASPEAIKQAQVNAHERGVTIQAYVADLETLPRLEENAYDLIICFNYLQRSLISSMKRWLRPGGMVVYETYIVDQARFGRPRNPAHLLCYNELLDFFRDFRVLRYREGIINHSRAVAGIVAERPA